MESYIWISLSEYIDPDQSQRFDHSGRNEIWREPFPPARTPAKARTDLAGPGPVRVGLSRSKTREVLARGGLQTAGLFGEGGGGLAETDIPTPK